MSGMRIEVNAVIEHDDGTATYVVDLSPDALLALAKIGLQHAITEAAKQVIDNGQVTQEDAGDRDDDGGE